MSLGTADPPEPHLAFTLDWNYTKQKSLATKKLREREVTTIFTTLLSDESYKRDGNMQDQKF